MAAASVTLTCSIARFRSGACPWAPGSVLEAAAAGLGLFTAHDPTWRAAGGVRFPGGASRDRHTGPVDTIVVRPSGPLAGTVRAGGAKNSALKLMAACLLAEGRHVLWNVPRITDVEIMAEMLRALGASVLRLDTGEMVVDSPPTDRLVPEAPNELVDKMRASVVVLGPLLARCGHARVSMPGGDDFGNRPIDFHLLGLGAMGASFTTSPPASPTALR